MTPRPAPRVPYSGTPNFQHHAPNAALLIDFDNVTMGIRSDLGKELKALLNSEVIRGKVAVQRAYADWRRYPQYIVPLAESSIDLIFAPAYGSSKKNATDLRMAIDAIELVFTRPEIGTYILMTGDSDFSSCVLKLKEYGKYVIGVGMRESSSDLLIQNCDEYYSYHSLSGLTRAGELEDSKEDPWTLVRRAAQQMIVNRDVMRTDRLKQVMLELDPGFDEKKIGYSKFSRFVQEASTKGLIRLRKAENGQYEIVSDEEESAAPAPEPAPPQREEGRRGRGREDGRREPRRESARRPEPVAEAPAQEEATPVEAVVPQAVQPLEQEAQEAAEPAVRSTPELQEAYGLLQEAVRELTSGSGRAVRDGDVKRRILAVAPGFDESALGFPKFTRFLRQAHDAEAIDLKRVNGGNYEVSLPSSGRRYSASVAGATRPAAEAAPRQPERERPPPAPEQPSEREPVTPAAVRQQPRPAATAAVAERPTASAPDEPAAPAPAARPAAPAYVGALRGRRAGRGAPLEGPPPLLPGQVVGVSRAPAEAQAPRVEEPETSREGSVVETPASSEATVAAPSGAPGELAEDAAGEERSGRSRARRGRRGRGRGRGERAGAGESLTAQGEAGAEEASADAPAVEAPSPASQAEPEPAVKSAPVAEVEEAGEPAPEPKKRGRGRTRGRKPAEPEPVEQASGFSAAEFGLPESRDEIVAYITSSYRGIGRRTAETLVDEVGERVFQTLEEDPDRVRALLGEGRTRTILDQWSTDIQRRRAAAAPPPEPEPKPKPKPKRATGGSSAAKKSAAKSRGRRPAGSRAKQEDGGSTG